MGGVGRGWVGRGVVSLRRLGGKVFGNQGGGVTYLSSMDVGAAEAMCVMSLRPAMRPIRQSEPRRKRSIVRRGLVVSWLLPLLGD